MSTSTQEYRDIQFALAKESQRQATINIERQDWQAAFWWMEDAYYRYCEARLPVAWARDAAELTAAIEFNLGCNPPQDSVAIRDGKLVDNRRKR
jgi:hypothetical protein